MPETYYPPRMDGLGLESLKSFLKSEDYLIRARAVNELGNIPGTQDLILGMMSDESEVVRDLASNAVSKNLEEFEDPVAILKQMAESPLEDIRSYAGGIAGSSLSRLIGPDRVFEEFATLDPKKYSVTHRALYLFFRINDEWFRKNSDAQNYIFSLFYGDYDPTLRKGCFDIICRLLPYKDNRVISAIQAAIEDDDPYIRVDGMSAKKCWIETGNRNKLLEHGD